jgi:GT2 family glycosyltransferase
VVATPSKSGPGAARNLGVETSSGEIVLFIDSDVVVRPDTIGRLASHFNGAAVAAVFGSYDDAPSVPDFISQYKNLQHHYVHQTGARDASTFWAGCGGIRRSVFLGAGGFDTVRFARPSIEDIELGYRLRDQGHRIVCDRELLVKHLKRWTVVGLIRTDLFDRAIPWSALILERGGAPRDLNVQNSERIAAAFVWISLGLVAMALVDLRSLIAAAVTVGGFLYVNRGFYGFLARRRGWLFAVRAIPLHALYYVYSSAAFVGTWLRQKLNP